MARGSDRSASATPRTLHGAKPEWLHDTQQLVGFYPPDPRHIEVQRTVTAVVGDLHPMLEGLWGRDPGHLLFDWAEAKVSFPAAVQARRHHLVALGWKWHAKP